MADQQSESPQHLCVLIHGLWGNPCHLDYLAASLLKSFPEDHLHILRPKTNAGNATYDGIEVGGERCTKEIEQEVERLADQNITIAKISVIGYSLGGLVGRYAIGILYHKGFFNQVEPVNFTTFATPHLGARSPSIGYHSHLWNAIGARTLSVSGQQIFLVDQFRDTNRPLLSVLADPDSVFIRALSAFKYRSLYSNIINDRSAVYYTTCITATDPYPDLSRVSINYLDNYKSVIVDHSNPVSRPPAKVQSPPTTFGGRLFGSFDIKPFLLRAQTSIFFAIFIPIGATFFLTNAAIQSFASAQRIKLHTTGKTGILPHSYQLPPMVQSVQHTAQDMLTNMNQAQPNEYLADSPDIQASERESEPGQPLKRSPERAAASTTTQLPMRELKKQIGDLEFPILALTDTQFAMIDALDAVGFNKYPVHITDDLNSHAAIIVRHNWGGWGNGKIIVKHWLDNFHL